MEKENPNPTVRAGEPLPAPPQSGFSTMLNGIGNGLMLGAAPLAITGFYSGISGKAAELPQWLHKTNLWLTAAGVALGAMFGLREAKHVNDYRQAVSDKLDTLETRATAAETRLNQWQERLAAEGPKTTEPAR